MYAPKTGTRNIFRHIRIYRYGYIISSRDQLNLLRSDLFSVSRKGYCHRIVFRKQTVVFYERGDFHRIAGLRIFLVERYTSHRHLCIRSCFVKNEAGTGSIVVYPFTAADIDRIIDDRCPYSRIIDIFSAVCESKRFAPVSIFLISVFDVSPVSVPLNMEAKISLEEPTTPVQKRYILPSLST